MTTNIRTIKQVLYNLVNLNFVATEEDADTVLQEIKEILDGAKPDKLVVKSTINGHGCDVTDHSGISDSYVKGYNAAIDQYHANLKKAL